MTPWASVTLAATPGQGPAPVAVPTRTAATTAGASAAAQALLLIDLSTPAVRRRFPNEPYTLESWISALEGEMIPAGVLSRSRGAVMSESVYRVTEVIGASPDSWEKAAANAVETAARSGRDLRSAEATRVDGTIQDGQG